VTSIVRPLAVALASIVLLGCGESSPHVTVAGRVALQEKPLPDAKLTFFPASGRPVTAQVSTDGQYEVELLPGEYRVVVDLGVALPPGYKEGDPLPPPPVMLPPKYTRRVDTPLTATVTPESATQTINLKLD
jgi:hypothetical protein